MGAWKRCPAGKIFIILCDITVEDVVNARVYTRHARGAGKLISRQGGVGVISSFIALPKIQILQTKPTPMYVTTYYLNSNEHLVLSFL